jgi:hypothetical protein
VTEAGVQFTAKLGTLVNAGVRPRLPDGCGPAPPGYKDLMERCWAGRYDARPSFATVVDVVAVITDDWDQASSRECAGDGVNESVL